MSCCCQKSSLEPGSGPLLSGTIENAATSFPAQSEQMPVSEASVLGGISKLPWWAKVILIASAVGAVAYFAHEGMKEKRA